MLALPSAWGTHLSGLSAERVCEAPESTPHGVETMSA